MTKVFTEPDVYLGEGTGRTPEETNTFIGAAGATALAKDNALTGA
jgi:hypothetical protein